MAVNIVFRFLRRPALWLSLPPGLIIMAFGVLPLLVITYWSFWQWDPTTYWIRPDLSFDAYTAMMETGRAPVLIRTFMLAFLAAGICLVIGYPAAYFIHFVLRGGWGLAVMMLFTIPFFTSYIIRTFSWRLVLGRHGPINAALVQLGIVDEPLEWLLFSDFAIEVGLVASYLPFVIFPILLSMRQVEPQMIQASLDLGAGFWKTLFYVVLPLTMSGVFAGFLFVFVMGLGSSTEVQLLGGAGASMISVMINDVMRVVNFPLAFAISTTVILLLLAIFYIGIRFLGFAQLFEEFSWRR